MAGPGDGVFPTSYVALLLSFLYLVYLVVDAKVGELLRTSGFTVLRVMLDGTFRSAGPFFQLVTVSVDVKDERGRTRKEVLYCAYIIGKSKQHYRNDHTYLLAAFRTERRLSDKTWLSRVKLIFINL